jgi:hypothetical protein
MPASPTKTKKSRSKFTLADLWELISAVIDINPFMAKHGQKGKMWERWLR